MRTWRLRLEDYGISDLRYDELRALCRRYDELRELERRYRLGDRGGKRTGNGAWKGRPDPTAAEALRRASSPYKWQIDAIEAAADNACGSMGTDVRRAIMRNVADGVPYERLGCVPCGRRQFYELRLLFFVYLDRELMRARVPGRRAPKN